MVLDAILLAMEPIQLLLVQGEMHQIHQFAPLNVEMVKCFHPKLVMTDPSTLKVAIVLAMDFKLGGHVRVETQTLLLVAPLFVGTGSESVTKLAMMETQQTLLDATRTALVIIQDMTVVLSFKTKLYRTSVLQYAVMDE